MELEAPLRIFVAEDHPIVRSGLAALVHAQPDMTLVGEAPDGLSAVEQVAELAPDVVVMDLAMPKLGGVEATERIRALNPKVKIVVLTAHDDELRARLVLAAGASGFVHKRAVVDDLVRAIRASAAGGVFIDPAVAAQVVVAGGPSGGRNPGQAELSQRESEVLRLIAEGHGVKDIAAKLAISTRTLETYRTRAMEKLSLKTRADIVQYALRRGWLAPQG